MQFYALDELLVLVVWLRRGSVGARVKKTIMNTNTHANRKKKKSLNVETDVPGVLITVISTPTPACLED